jgi:hypothetical protein
MPRTEEARGSNPLTSTPQQPWSPAWRATSAGPVPYQSRCRGSRWAATANGAANCCLKRGHKPVSLQMVEMQSVGDQDSDGESSDPLPAGEFGRLPRSRLTETRASRQPAGHGRWQGEDTPSARAARWQAPQPCRSRPGHPWPGRLDPYVIPYAQEWRTPGFGSPVHMSSSVPLGGVERALGKVRFARLIHSGARVSWRTYGPRRLRRHSDAARIATYGGRSTHRLRGMPGRHHQCAGRPIMPALPAPILLQHDASDALTARSTRDACSDPRASVRSAGPRPRSPVPSPEASGGSGPGESQTPSRARCT